MAEETQTDRLKELALRAAASRQTLGLATVDLRASGNVSRRMTTSIRSHITTWMGSAALMGWILSRLPARKTTVYKTPGKLKGKEAVADHVAGKAQKGGMMVALVGLLFQAVRPALQKYLLELVRKQAQKRMGGPSQPASAGVTPARPVGRSSAVDI